MSLLAKILTTVLLVPVAFLWLVTALAMLPAVLDNSPFRLGLIGVVILIPAVHLLIVRRLGLAATAACGAALLALQLGLVAWLNGWIA